MPQDRLSSLVEFESLKVSGDYRGVGLLYVREIREFLLERKGVQPFSNLSMGILDDGMTFC